MTGGVQRWEHAGTELKHSTMLELFFDLAFVLVLTQLTDHLATHLSVLGLFQTAVLTAAVWWVWTVVSWVCDFYSSANPGLQLLVIVLTFGVIVMAVAVHAAFGRLGLMFACAYVGVHLVLEGTLLVGWRGKVAKRLPLRVILWFLVSAPLWILGGMLHGSRQLMLWTAAIAVGYAGAATGWLVPLLGRLRPDRWHSHSEHLAERYRQILLIGLGDAFITMGAAWVESPTTPLRSAVLALAFVHIVLLLQTYHRVAGERLAELISRSRNEARTVQLSVHCHLLMVLGIVVNVVAIDIVIREPLEPQTRLWIGVIAGPTLFMVGRILFGRLVLGRISPSRVITLVGLLAVAPVAGVLPPILVGVVVTAVVATVQLPRISKRFARWIHEPVLEER